MTKKFIAYDIEWNVDTDELTQLIREKDFDEICEIMNQPISRYSNMSDERKLDIALDFFHHRPGAIDELIGVPSEIEIPDEVITYAGIADDDDDMSDVTDWLSDEYGFFINGYRVRAEER